MTSPDETQRRIAELEAELARLRGAPTPAPEISQPINVSGGYVGQIIAKAIFGRDPHEDEARRLGWYLEKLSHSLRRVPLRVLDDRLDQGDGLAMDRVYVMPATTGQIEVARGVDHDLQEYFTDGDAGKALKNAYMPDFALPDRAITGIGAIVRATPAVGSAFGFALASQYAPHGQPNISGGQLGSSNVPPSVASDTLPPDVPWPNQKTIPANKRQPRPGDAQNVTRILSRAQLASEAIAANRKVVLLGDPGSGKSTFVRHLAWSLACRSLGDNHDAPALLGWEQDQHAMPVILPLRALAGRVAADGPCASTMLAALSAEVESYRVPLVDDMITAALSCGSVLLLCDGLDEVPLGEVPGVSAGRLSVLKVVRSFVDMHPAVRVVVTCRTRAFSDDLRALLGWDVVTIAPFTLGQVRYFARSWYSELAAKGQVAAEQAANLSKTLIDAIVGSPRLKDLAQTPLLLTLMAVLLLNRNELPRDRAQLYERILDLLLGQWDQVRNGESLGQVLGLADWSSERIAPLLNRLSYQAHAEAASEDGRGRLGRSAVYDALITFFEEAKLPDAWGAAGRCLEYFNQRSGLIAPDGPENYVFAHLTLQEHCAGRHLLISRDPLGRVLSHRHDDRWREPIMLGLGVVQPINPYLVEKVLRWLIGHLEDGHAKAPIAWHRDLIFAAEIGKDRGWDYLREQGVDCDRVQGDLRSGLAALLDDENQPLPLADRIHAGTLLGELGDPRLPVMIEEWAAQSAQRSEQFGSPSSYWCYVPGGRYSIGGWQEGEPSAAIVLPPFWVARFPITVAQYAPFVSEGYADQGRQWWTEAGWKWRLVERRMTPGHWGEPLYDQRNYPVIGMSWYEATAFCHWLNDQLAGALPVGFTVRLLSEAEWEVAASYDPNGSRRTYPWGGEDPRTDLASYDELRLGHPISVGCCAAGASPCGAMDMAGNVLELTTSSYRGYPGLSNLAKSCAGPEDEDIPLRGGAWALSGSYLRSGWRERTRRGGRTNAYQGFRVVLASPLVCVTGPSAALAAAAKDVYDR